ncbi:MAG: dsrE/DsrF-like family protein [Herbinix sp.]|nr:dsrE/DsrF-like family protein [Herbinix sp.]
MKVVFHIDDLEKWNMALNNIKNMLQYGRDYVFVFDIEIVTNGPAITGLTEEFARRQGLYVPLKEVYDSNVKILACENTMILFKIQDYELCNFVKTVPSGVVEIATKQGEGYAYLKP